MTEDIRLYNLKFELLCIAHRVKSSSWELYYNKIGSFEAHIIADKYITPVIFDTDYLIAVEGNKQAFCTARQINTEIVLYGKTLNYLLSKRTVMPFNTSRDGIINNPVLLCNKLVSDVFITDRTIEDAYGNTAIIRGVHNMTVTDNSADFETGEKFYRTAAHPLSEVIIERLDEDKLGHKLVFDTAQKLWRFEIYKGIEVPLVLSQANRNFYNTDYTSDISDVFNAGYYEPTTEQTTEQTTESDASDTETNTETDIDWEEQDSVYKFVANSSYNANTDEYTAICEWDTILSGTEQSEALSTLKSHILQEELTGKAARLKFGTDYDLGDVLRVQLTNVGIKRTLTVRVVGVKLYRESNEITSEPILESD